LKILESKNPRLKDDKKRFCNDLKDPRNEMSNGFDNETSPKEIFRVLSELEVKAADEMKLNFGLYRITISKKANPRKVSDDI